MPTHSERAYWGATRAISGPSIWTSAGVGGLVCYEHHKTLLCAAVAAKGEEPAGAMPT